MDTSEIDARGLLCPLPVLKVRKRLNAASTGTRIALWADDPAAVVDVPHYCTESGNRLVETREVEGAMLYVIEKT